MSRIKLLFFQLLVAVVAIGLWHLLTTVPEDGDKLLPPFFFSTPGAVASRIVKWFSEGTIWRHLGITLTESVLAFVIGSVAARRFSDPIGKLTEAAQWIAVLVNRHARARIPTQVLSFEVVAAHDEVESAVHPFEPNRRKEHIAALSIGREGRDEGLGQ